MMEGVVDILRSQSLISRYVILVEMGKGRILVYLSRLRSLIIQVTTSIQHVSVNLRGLDSPPEKK